MIPIPSRLALKLSIGIACALLLILLVHDRNRWKAKTEHYAELLAGERAAHAATLANVRAATDEARRADAANVARARAEQAAINERTSDDYQSRIAAARAVAERLRASANAATDSGGRRITPVPGLSVAAQAAAQDAGEDRLSQPDQRAARDRAALGPADALTATEQAIQLDELIKWVRAQAAVEPSKD